MITHEQIKEMLLEELRFDFDRNTRKEKYILARAIYFKLVRVFIPTMSLDLIGRTLKFRKDHSTVLYGIRTWDETYCVSYPEYLKVYLTIYEKLDAIPKPTEEITYYNGEDQQSIINKNLKLQTQVNDLKNKVAHLEHQLRIEKQMMALERRKKKAQLSKLEELVFNIPDEMHHIVRPRIEAMIKMLPAEKNLRKVV